MLLGQGVNCWRVMDNEAPKDGFGWIRMDSNGSDWIGLDRNELEWIGMDRIGSEWIGIVNNY